MRRSRAFRLSPQSERYPVVTSQRGKFCVMGPALLLSLLIASLALTACGSDGDSSSATTGAAPRTTTADPPSRVTLRDLQVNGDSAYAYAGTQADADGLCTRLQQPSARPNNLPPAVVGVTFRNGENVWTVCLLPNSRESE